MGIAERKKRDQDRRRQQIIVAARRVLSTHSYNSLNLSDIAEEAEISPSTIYLYFRNKEALLLALSTRILEYLKMRLKHIDEDKRQMPLEKRLEAICDALIETFEYDPKMMTLTLHMQDSEAYAKASNKISASLKGQLLDIIDDIDDIIKQDINLLCILPESDIIAKMIWSQFTGAVLVNKILTTEDYEIKDKVYVHLKWCLNNLFLSTCVELDDKKQFAVNG